MKWGAEDEGGFELSRMMEKSHGVPPRSYHQKRPYPIDGAGFLFKPVRFFWWALLAQWADWSTRNSYSAEISYRIPQDGFPIVNVCPQP